MGGLSMFKDYGKWRLRMNRLALDFPSRVEGKRGFHVLFFFVCAFFRLQGFLGRAGTSFPEIVKA